MDYLFYKLEPEAEPTVTATPLHKPYETVVWKPTILSVCPRGLPNRRTRIAFALWWAMYLFTRRSKRHLFLVVYDGNTAVHYTGLMPRCVKFPFMGADDLQVGPAWTHDDHRRKGLLTHALGSLLTAHRKPNRSFWWVCRRENAASCAAIERAGFTLSGLGGKERRLPIPFITRFMITKTSTSPAAPGH
jgi:RimJ/RimL family protein N-acetyltransferase